MAPARTGNRRGQREQNLPQHNVQPEPMAESLKDDLFLEPMMGTPLAIYVEKDVENRDSIVDLITKHGGVVSPGYSGVPYILVDPHKESGQNLYRQYIGKKGKIVLSANWVIECISLGVLQTYHHNWAGCKVTGTEKILSVVQPGPSPGDGLQMLHEELAHQVPPQVMQPPHAHAMMAPPMAAAPSDTLVHHPQHPFPYSGYPPAMDVAARAMHPPTAAPPQSWQLTNGIAPQQTHMAPPQPQPMPPRHHHGFREDQPWTGAYQPPPPGAMVPNPSPEYDYNRFREDQAWVGPTTDYYAPPYEPPYPEPDAYMNEAGPSNAESSTTVAETSEKGRGRKRVRTQAQPAPPASTLVLNRRNPPARSPTPPSRVIKSTYGGNLFTSDDVLYLKKYIDYCQEQGLVLSLREICERIAVKAPHHTFYSWRRYCNKHQIRLGGYAMDVNDRAESPGAEDEQGQMQGQIDPDPQAQNLAMGAAPGTIAAARQAAEADVGRTRSPTPPRALFRSTTGKGVAFTDEDVTFLVRFLHYRNRTQDGKVDMVNFWKDVATKAPHHSRASWMKFYRRHKHELHHTDGDAPLPAPPEKKMRYSRSDDVLLANYFVNKPEGTSDKIFQAFGRIHPHHPWKGWQEHHRIHKAKIDHLIQKLSNGENIEEGLEE
ncbi:hypothetical protein B0H21DRAFT_804204 [Amylocystis lapponica]|nr:hypothetical protein B0H21DRAFT_804204 [Amylocystis lapponica]